jgi:Cyclin, N-terminal domain
MVVVVSPGAVPRYISYPTIVCHPPPLLRIAQFSLSSQPYSSLCHSGCKKTPSVVTKFIARVLSRAKLDQSVVFAGLVLLQRLKARFPSTKGCGYRLFISAYMIASKVVCDRTYSNQSWTIVAQGLYTLMEIHRMERQMCSCLDWELNVDGKTTTSFESVVKKGNKSHILLILWKWSPSELPRLSYQQVPNQISSQIRY